MKMEIFNVITKFINDSLNQDETRVLERIEKGKGNNSRFFSIIKDYFSYREVKHTLPDKERIYKKIIKDTGNFTYTYHKTSPNKRITKLNLVTYAAAASVALLLSIGLWKYVNNSQGELNILIEAPLAQTKEVILPDSSKVWLNGGSSLRYAKNFLQDRRVSLTGEAFFDVKKFNKSTFRVLVNEFNVEVLGTTFNIKAYNNQQSEVKLYTGKVNFELPELGKVITLRPMEGITYNPATKEVQVSSFEKDDFDWRSGEYKFTDKPLKEIISILNRNYNVHIALSEEQLGESLFSGAINKNEPLVDVLDKICISTGLTKTADGDSITLY